MNGTEWTPVLEESTMAFNGVRTVFPKGLGVILIRKAGSEIYAVSNKCPHLGCPLQSGKIDGYILTCPCHEWRFDIRTGAFLDSPEIVLKTFDLKISDGRIWVKI